MPAPATLDLQGFCYQEREGALPALNLACTESGGWLIERTTLAANIIEFRIEIQLHRILELYANLAATGVELTRAAQSVLSNLCTCRHHIALTGEPNQILSLCLKLSFLDGVTLQSLLMTGSQFA
jgi:hypothetical protein